MPAESWIGIGGGGRRSNSKKSITTWKWVRCEVVRQASQVRWRRHGSCSPFGLPRADRQGQQHRQHSAANPQPCVSGLSADVSKDKDIRHLYAGRVGGPAWTWTYCTTPNQMDEGSTDLLQPMLHCIPQSLWGVVCLHLPTIHGPRSRQI